MASEAFKLLAVVDTIVVGIDGSEIDGVFDENLKTEESEFDFVADSAGFPLLEREVEEEGKLKEKGEKVIFTLGPPGRIMTKRFLEYFSVFCFILILRFCGVPL